MNLKTFSRSGMRKSKPLIERHFYKYLFTSWQVKMIPDTLVIFSIGYNNVLIKS